MLGVTIAFVVVLLGCGSSSDDSGSSGSGSTSSAPVDIGNVMNKGSKDISSEAAPKLEVEADDTYFKPTFIKAKPGAKVTVELHNEGGSEHTFTIDGTDVDQDLAPDAKADVSVTVPQNGALEFHCRFHGSAGMKGAFYTADGAAVTNASSSGSTTSSGGGLYGG
jgi:plastocyanin